MKKASIAVDLDGTLMRGDSFLLGCRAAAQKDFFQFVAKIFSGLAPLKWWMYRHLMNEKSLAQIKFHTPLIAWLQEQKAAGAEVILVSAAPDYFLEEIKNRVGQGSLFSSVIGSTATENRRGSQKAAVLVERFGQKNFDYIGNSQADVPVWKAARTAYNVNPSRGLMNSARAAGVQLQLLLPNPQHWLMEAWDVIKRVLKT